MSSEEYRNMNQDELRVRERELSEDLFHLRLQHATGQLRNSARLRSVRRDIARVKTVLNQRGGEQ